jgi:hypothetical protein
MTRTRVNRVRTGGGLLVMVLAVLAGPVQPTFGQREDPRREPATAVTEVIRLLEKKDYVAVLETFMHPEDLKRQLTRKTIQVLATEFGERKASDVLSVFKEAAKMTPTLSPDGTRAQYRFSKPIGGDDDLSLVKIGDYWFIR